MYFWENKMASLQNVYLCVIVSVLVVTAVSQSALRVNPAEAEDAHSKYSLHNRQQCQRLCWYTGVCLRYSYRTKTQTSADNRHNCVIHVTEGEGEELADGWTEEMAAWASLSKSYGCKERPCGNQTLCVPSASQAIAHVCARIPDINECSSSPCENGGSCQAQVNAYTCNCVAGYSGNRCETVVDECLSGPCENGGSCQDQVNAYTCTCAAGFTGDNCQTNVDECSSSPCQNGGSCQDQVNAYTCNCTAGYMGDHCQTNVDECQSSPCQNGGSCQDQVNNYTCTCDLGFSGDHCQTELQTLLNDGSVLLFRVTPSIATSAYDRFMAVGDSDDNTAAGLRAVPRGCTTTDGSLACDQHYRSRHLDAQPLTFKTIRIGLYMNGVEKAFFEFNATGANSSGWLQQHRLVDTSYKDLTATEPADTPNGRIFSITGDGSYGKRRFFINYMYNSCETDDGWLVVLDTHDGWCGWEQLDSLASVPTIIFMGGGTHGAWGSGGGLVADVMVITGQLGLETTTAPDPETSTAADSQIPRDVPLSPILLIPAEDKLT